MQQSVRSMTKDINLIIAIRIVSLKPTVRVIRVVFTRGFCTQYIYLIQLWRQSGDWLMGEHSRLSAWWSGRYVAGVLLMHNSTINPWGNTTKYCVRACWCNHGLCSSEGHRRVHLYRDTHEGCCTMKSLGGSHVRWKRQRCTVSSYNELECSSGKV